jgi:DNA invertase Pin-like site-specific DNA recombinase
MAIRRGKISKEEWAKIRAAVHAAREKAARENYRPEPERPPMVFGYRRCSHRDSQESGLGMAAQEGTISAYYTLLCSKWREAKEQVLAFHSKIFSDEAVSARRKLVTRAEGRALDLALKRGDHVVFPRLDRGFRDLEDLIRTTRDWDARGVTIHFVNEGIDCSTSIGRLIMHILGAVAQWQSEYIGDRAREMAVIYRSLGRNGNGKPPIGYKLIGPKSAGMRRKLVPDMEQRKVMSVIVKLRDEQKMTWDAISEYIEQKLAAQENRKPIRYVDQGKRKWSRHRCQIGYENELKIRAKAKERLDKEQQNE